MKQLLHSINTIKYKSFLFIVLGISLGVIIALSFRAVRYSDYFPPTMQNIDPKTAYENIQKNPSKYIFIDVRSEFEYAKAHASGSVNLPIHYMYDDTHGLKNEKGIPLPKNTDQEIYLLCTGGRLAGVAYSYLEHYGYRNIKRIDQGLAGWNDAGLPMIAPDIFKKLKEGSYDTSGDTSRGTAPLDRPYEVK